MATLCDAVMYLQCTKLLQWRRIFNLSAGQANFQVFLIESFSLSLSYLNAKKCRQVHLSSKFFRTEVRWTSINMPSINLTFCLIRTLKSSGEKQCAAMAGKLVSSNVKIHEIQQTALLRLSPLRSLSPSAMTVLRSVGHSTTTTLSATWQSKAEGSVWTVRRSSPHAD